VIPAPPPDDRTRWLPEPEALRLLSGYDLPVIPHRLATSPDEADRAARSLGCPVAMKVVAAGLVHKSDIGGVQLDLRTPEEAAATFTILRDRLAPHVSPFTFHGILVAKMAPPGTEVIVGMVRDPQFGPAVMAGLGGIFVELYKDVVFRLPPLRPAEARSMLMELKAAPLLTGYRGQPPRDLDALAACACAVARIAADHPEIQEIDLNPIIAFERGCTIADAKIRVSP
jgi:acyl-CoA synthetase (NDP forming)